MTVLIADARGTVLDQHDTPLTCAEKRATHVLFGNHQVFLRVSLEEMERQGAGRVSLEEMERQGAGRWQGI